MQYVIIGLGNPEEEYDNTRHNTGRIVLDAVRREFTEEVLEFDKKVNALVAKVKIGKNNVLLVAPETFMNKSGQAASKLIKNPKDAQRLIVIQDDFSLPLGKLRISFNRSSGGHNGLQSIIKALKTEAFTRIRVGIAPEDSKGNAKLLHGDDKIIKFILGKYKSEELKIIKKTSGKVAEAVRTIVEEGREKAMSVVNSQ